MKNFIITTTDTIEGATIVKYIELVSANIVIGANVFSDFAASFTDFFGGYSIHIKTSSIKYTMWQEKTCNRRQQI